MNVGSRLNNLTLDEGILFHLEKKKTKNDNNMFNNDDFKNDNLFF